MINRKWVQTKKTQLYTSIGSTANTILLKNAFRLDGNLLDMEDDFGAIGFMTLEPGGLKEEIISFTGLSYNLSGTILTLSGVSRGLSGSSAYGSGGVAYGHSANRVAIFTNNPQHYEGFANKYNEETITQVWTFLEAERPKLDVDNDAVLAEEFITLGQVNRLIQATFLLPVVVSTSQGSTGLVQGQITPFAHTVPSGLANGGTFVVVQTQEDVTISSITLGAQNFTQVATETRAGSNQRIEIWRLLAPTAGTGNITVTTSGNAYSTAQVVTLENVNQSTPVDALSTGADGSGTAITDSITTLTANSVILMAVGGDTDPTTFTPTAPLAELIVDDSGTLRPTSTSVRSTTTAGVYNLAYTIAASQDFVTKAIAIRGVAGGGGGSDAFTVGATSADTTPDFLDDKIEIVSSDSSVLINKTVQNPGANEKISYDLSAVGGGNGGAGVKLAIDTTQFVSGSSTYVDMYTVNIPGGTLSTNDAIRFTIISSSLDLGSGDRLRIKVLYGASEVVPETLITGDGTTAPVTITGFVIADNATNAQKGQSQIEFGDGSSKQIVTGYGTATVDSTVDQNLVIQMRFETGTDLMTAEGIIVEKITDGGSSSEKKIGVGDISDINWFNIQLPFSMVDGTNPESNVWDIQASGLVVNPSLVNLSDGEYFSISADQNALLPDISIGGQGEYKFDSNKQAIFSCAVYTTTDTNTNKGGIGFNAIGSNAIITAQGGNALSVGFVRSSAGQWYARCATGSAFTETAITIPDGKNVIRCEYDPGNVTPKARFYVNGVLVATITTNVPSSVATVVGWAAGQNTAAEIALDAVTCPSFAVEL